MLTINGWDEAGHVRETCLHFEDFLEALVRLSVLIALPTDDEIEAAGCNDAGEFMAHLRFENCSAFAALHAQRSGDWPSAEPSQPIERCIAHTLAIIFGRMQEQCHAIAKGGAPISEAGLARRWLAVKAGAAGGGRHFALHHEICHPL